MAITNIIKTECVKKIDIRSKYFTTRKTKPALDDGGTLSVANLSWLCGTINLLAVPCPAFGLVVFFYDLTLKVWMYFNCSTLPRNLTFETPSGK